MKKSHWPYFLIPVYFFLTFSCAPATEENKEEVAQEPVEESPAITYDVNNPTSIVQAVAAAAGGWNNLWKLRDVQFNYDYAYPGESIKDISLERYVFDNEYSWAKYSRHEINVMPGTEGEVIQCYDGEKAMLSHNGAPVNEEAALAGCEFLRKANYFWFTMNFKLADPGTSHEYLGQEEHGGTAYDKVKVAYNSNVTEKEQNDTYILYVNPKTKLVDRFYFSLPFMQVIQPVLLMEVEYEEVEGMQLASKRRIYMPGEDGSYPEEPSLVQTMTDIKFNNQFTSEQLSI